MGILIAFVIALLVSLLFTPYKKGEAGSLVVFFLVLFLSALAAQYWVIPFGPVMWGVTWLPMLFVVFIFALLFSSPSPSSKIKTGAVAGANTTEQAAGTLTAISIFIWLLFCLLLLAIILGLYHSNIAIEKSFPESEIIHKNIPY